MAATEAPAKVIAGMARSYRLFEESVYDLAS
jgi:hypothetical protein